MYIIINYIIIYMYIKKSVFIFIEIFINLKSYRNFNDRICSVFVFFSFKTKSTVIFLVNIREFINQFNIECTKKNAKHRMIKLNTRQA